MTRNEVKIWFTSRNIFDREYNDSNWEKYIEWSRLNQLLELVSLDGILNDLTFEPEFDAEIEVIVIEENQVTQFFKSIDYVKKKSTHLDFYNLLAVVKEPKQEKQIQLERDFEFIGYDLIEIGGQISALTNCGGFDETFKSKEQNSFGLISDFDRAKEIQLELLKNNPDEHHADCYLFEVWRHKFIGRNSFNIEFCFYLGNQIIKALEKSNINKLKGWWCDGINSERISKKNINDNRKIETVAWLGKSGKEKYDLTIQFGKRSLRRFAKGTSMIDCIPSPDTMEWIDIDLNKNRIEIELK